LNRWLTESASKWSKVAPTAVASETRRLCVQLDAEAADTPRAWRRRRRAVPAKTYSTPRARKKMPPNFCRYLRQILTDFRNSDGEKFALKRLVNIPPPEAYFLFYRNVWFLPFCSFFPYIYISQGSVATQLRCGGIFNNRFIANFPRSVPVKEVLKSVDILRRYGQKFGGLFFWFTVCVCRVEPISERFTCLQ